MLANAPGERFGRLVLQEVVPRDAHNTRWRCLCDCGNEILVYQPNLKSGRVASCGCKLNDYRDSRKKKRTFSGGYAFVWCPEHPRSHHGRVREHILVMEEFLGRRLFPGEEVHHLNTLRSDNRLENLELWVHGQPAGARVTDIVEWATEMLLRYAPERLEK